MFVNTVSYFFSDFNQDGRSDNISFMIKRVKVHSEDALRDPNYRFPGNYGVEKYLELFSGIRTIIVHVKILNVWHNVDMFERRKPIELIMLRHFSL